MPRASPPGLPNTRLNPLPSRLTPRSPSLLSRGPREDDKVRGWWVVGGGWCMVTARSLFAIVPFLHPTPIWWVVVGDSKIPFAVVSFRHHPPPTTHESSGASAQNQGWHGEQQQFQILSQRAGADVL